MASTLLSLLPLEADFTSAPVAPAFGVRNGHRLIAFGDAVGPSEPADETCIFTAHMPQGYAQNGLDVVIMWVAETAIVGDVIWEVSFERNADEDLDIDADSFATGKTVTATAPGTNGHVQYSTITFTDAEIDGVLPGEQFRLRLRRLTSDSSDTMVDHAQVTSIRLSQTDTPGGGGSISAWTSTTFVGSWSTNTTYEGFSRQVGENREYMVEVSLSGAPDTAALTLTIPNSEQIDFSKIPSRITGASDWVAVGYGLSQEVGLSFRAPLIVYADEDTGDTVVGIAYTNSPGTAPTTLGNVDQANPFTFGANDIVWVKFSVPIVGLTA